MTDKLIMMSDYPENINGFKIFPIKLKNILEIGENEYQRYLGIICLSKKNLLEGIEDEEIRSLSLYELIVINCLGDIKFKKMFLDGLKIFLKEDFFVDDYGIYINKVNEKKEIIKFYMNDDTYKLIISTIKKQNFLQDDENHEYKPANSKAQEWLEKMKKAKEKIKKEKNEENLSLGDIVSIVACYSNDINILNVWDLTVYQLYTVYLRLIMWDDYQTKQNLLPHVSDAKSLDLQHWATSVDNKLNKK